MAAIEYEARDKIALVTMNNGENKQNPAFASGLLEALDRAEEDRSIRAMVLTSSDEKNWSQGVDLAFLMQAMQQGKHDEIRAFMYDMNSVFSRFLLAPFPVIAAINGHAYGNGAMLACACDFRFMRNDRGYFCFPEVDISIPFLPSMIQYVQKAMPQYRFNELKLTGRRVTAAELEADHVIEKAFPDAAATLEGALEFAAGFNKKRPIFAEHKRRLHKHIIETMETEDKPLIEALQLMV